MKVFAIRWGFILLLFIGSSFTWAEKNAPAAGSKEENAKPALEIKNEDAYKLIENVSNDLLDMLGKEGEKALKENPEALFQKVEAMLAPVVHFNFISKRVMGKKYWEASTPDQRLKFEQSFKRSMVETLAKGMVNFADLEATVLPPNEKPENKPRRGFVEVVQLVKSSTANNKVVYSMAYSTKSNNWKLINVTLNGVNLGSQFKEQFAQSVKQYKGNIDQVIANWSEV